MPRDVDERKKRKALRKIRKAAILAEQGLGPPLSDWEKQFLEEVEERIEKFGSAFHDLEKGGADEALSSLQYVKLREIDKKARGKGKSGAGHVFMVPDHRDPERIDAGDGGINQGKNDVQIVDHDIEHDANISRPK